MSGYARQDYRLPGGGSIEFEFRGTMTPEVCEWLRRFTELAEEWTAKRQAEHQEPS